MQLTGQRNAATVPGYIRDGGMFLDRPGRHTAVADVEAGPARLPQPRQISLSTGWCCTARDGLMDA